MQRYFIEEVYKEKATYELKEDSYHHIVHVMRMKVNEQLFIVFADQIAVLAEIFEIAEDRVLVKPIRLESETKEMPIQITVASGFPKGDKLEWIVQKGTELGAHAFIGFPAKSSIVKWDQKKLQKKQQRLEKIAQEAAEQSHRQRQPRVQLLASLNDLLTEMMAFDTTIIAYEESAKAGERANLMATFASLSPGAKVLAVFGPEGGLSPVEVQAFEDQGGVICGLGPRILRTETAPLYLLSAASYHFELASSR